MKVSLKKWMFLAASLFICNAVSAADGPVIPTVTITSGGTATVSFEFVSETISTYMMSSFTISLPEGFSIDTNSPAVTGRASAHSIQIEETDTEGEYKGALSTQSADGYITGSSGALFTFKLECDGTVSDGDYTATVKEIVFTYKDGKRSKKATFDDITFNITVGAAATSVDINLANEWNTYCYGDHTLDFTDVSGAEAYFVSDVTPTSAKLTRVYKIDGTQGILIKRTTADSKITVPFTIDDPDAGTNYLVGVTEPFALPAGNYILVDGKFVKSNGEGQLGANKAYLPADAVPLISPDAAKVITLDFDGDATGINEIQKAETEGAIYNLSGMRVSKTQKGVYIMNGRKVIVK